MNTELQENLIETSIPLEGNNVNKLSNNCYQLRMKVRTGRYTGSPVHAECRLIPDVNK